MQDLGPGDLIAAAGNDLVHIHIGLGAASGLEDDQREFFRQLSGQHFVADAGDQRGAFLVQIAQIPVGKGGGFLQDGESLDDLRRHLMGADLKIIAAAFGLGAPVALGGNADFAHGIVFDAVFAHVLSPFIKA